MLYFVNLDLIYDRQIKGIYDTYYNLRDEKEYENIQGFSKSASIEQVTEHEHILTRGGLKHFGFLKSQFVNIKFR